MHHSLPHHHDFVNKTTTTVIFLLLIAMDHFLDHRISGLMTAQYNPTSYQQMWMPFSQIMEQLLVVQARHRLQWHRQSEGSRYTLDLRFQKTAIKSTFTMILNETCKSYTLVPPCHMVSGLFSRPRNKTVEYGSSIEYWLQRGSQKFSDQSHQTSKSNSTVLPKSIGAYAISIFRTMVEYYYGWTKTKICFKLRWTMPLSPKQTIIHGRLMESPIKQL